MKKSLLILLLVIFDLQFSNAQTVTALNGFYRKGQVFLTWQNIAGSEAYYKVYRSLSPISDSTQLSSAEYLGWVDQFSAKNFNLSQHDSTDVYLRLDSAGIPLLSGSGLFVATTLANGQYYYAVTSILNGIESKKIIGGKNSLAGFIAEQVTKPQPVYQEKRSLKGKNFGIYVLFISTKQKINSPPANIAGFLAFDFGLYLNNATSNKPLNIRFHPGGQDFYWSITSPKTDEINLNIEDELPSTESLGDWGANENYNIYKLNGSNTIPTSGTNYNLIQTEVNQILDWAITHLPVDSNRIYLEGDSNGSPGAFFYAITYPERVAAVKVTVGCFNFAFNNDYDPNCSLNEGKPNRIDGNTRMGLITTNLMCNLGIPTYNALNGGWMIHAYNEKNYPFIYSMNGKKDSKMGWTEKTIYYDSVNANHAGGYYFWDNRDHAGNNKTWTDNNFNLFRYRKDLSYPAISNCSLNEDFGDGNGNTGVQYGTVNGAVDWKNEITETSQLWISKVFVRNLLKIGGAVVYPDSCTADVSPRRLKKFNVVPGQTINWSVSHHNQIIQSGALIYNGGIITIPGVKIFRDTSVISISGSTGLNTYYLDGDHDDYGNTAQSVQASSPPPGYVADHTDCNDANAAIHPGAADICNGADDNCNLVTDENAIAATINPAGTVSVCKGTPVSLTANSGSGISYQWKMNDANISGATNQVYSTPLAGTYKVSEMNPFNCSSQSAGTKIKTIGLPTATITPQGSLNICATGSVLFKATTGASLTYQWKKGNNNINGATNSNYTAASTGTYKVMITNNSGCSKTSAGVVVTKSCREESNSLNSISSEIFIYPDPSDGKFSLRFSLNDVHESSESNTVADIEIMNVVGQLVYTGKAVFENGSLNKEILLQTVPEGWYLVRIFLNDKNYSGRLIIKR